MKSITIHINTNILRQNKCLSISLRGRGAFNYHCFVLGDIHLLEVKAFNNPSVSANHIVIDSIRFVVSAVTSTAGTILYLFRIDNIVIKKIQVSLIHIVSYIASIRFHIFFINSFLWQKSLGLIKSVIEEETAIGVISSEVQQRGY